MKYVTPTLLLMLSAAALRGEGEITIYTRFAQPVPNSSIDSMKAELDAILPLLRFDWRPLDGASGHEVMDEILVVTFKGGCHTAVLPPITTPSGALGWISVTDGQVLPFADVDCDKIRELLGSYLAITPPRERERLMGRAMARVLAHELFHYFAKSTKHSSTGVAKAFYTGADLAADHLNLNAAQLEIVRHSRMHQVTSEPTGPVGGGQD